MAHVPCEGKVTIDVPPMVEYLAFVRHVVIAAAGIAPKLASERLDDLRLAVSEATTNAIEAQRKVGSTDPIRITCALGGGEICVEIRDHGGGFDPESLVPHPPVTDPERLEFERGLGIPLMRTLADEHEILPTPDGTIIRLVLYTD